MQNEINELRKNGKLTPEDTIRIKNLYNKLNKQRMKQIDIKKPKYIIPILILPFILGIGWLVKDMINSAPAEETTLVETEELNLDIPDANLEKER